MTKSKGDSASRAVDDGSNTSPFNTFEDILEAIKTDGLWQNIMVYSCLISLTLLNMTSYSQGIFEIGHMSYKCYKYEDGTYAANFVSTAPVTATPAATANFTKLANSTVTPASIACTSPLGSPCVAWNYSSPYYTKTMVSEWNLICTQSYKRSMYQSIYTIGALVGLPVLATLSDMYGRRTVILLGWPFLALCCLGTAFAPVFWFAVCMRVLLGAFGGGDWKAKMVLVLEIMMPKQRNFSSALLATNWPIAGIVVAVTAYFIHDWRFLQLIVSITALVSLPFVLILPESPRWLITHQKFDRARAILERASRWNGRGELPASLNLKTLHNRHGPDNTKILSPLQRFASLFITSDLRRRTAILLIQWVIVAVVFFGMIFYGTGVLPGNPYYTVGIMCLVRIVSLPLQVYVLNRFGCRKAIIGWLMFAAVIIGALAALFIASKSGVPLGPAKPILSMILVVAGTWAADNAWNALYILTGEIYPTISRQTGMSFCSMISRIGGGASPFIANMLGDVWLPLPAIIFAALAAVSSALALLLPSTLNIALPDTIHHTRVLLTEATTKTMGDGMTAANDYNKERKSGDGEATVTTELALTANLRPPRGLLTNVSTTTVISTCDEKKAEHED